MTSACSIRRKGPPSVGKRKSMYVTMKMRCKCEGARISLGYVSLGADIE